MDINKLLDYYIECVEIESFEEYSFASFRLNIDFISAKIDNKVSLPLPTQITGKLALNRQSTLYYGWPVFAKQAITQNGSRYFWIEPLFLLKIEYEPNNRDYKLTLVKEFPRVNSGVIKRYARTAEEKAQIIDAIGLEDMEIFPGNGLKEYYGRLRKIIADIPQLSDNYQNIQSINSEGVYNTGIVFISGISNYNRQLIKELRQLRVKNIKTLNNEGALYALINGSVKSKDNNHQLSQITHLNRSQRIAVNRSFNNSISVITGPPGTGKSQVVLNILVNAFENNLSVLFASKNNKAVDVVCERILKEIRFPINLRLGPRTETRHYTIEFLDLLDSILSGTSEDNIEINFNRAKKSYNDAKLRYDQMLSSFEKIVSVRNRINIIDEEMEGLEKVLDEECIKAAQGLKFDPLGLLKQASKEIELLKSDNWPVHYKFFKIFSKKYPFKKLHYIMQAACDSTNNIIPISNIINTNVIYYSELCQNIEALYSYCNYFLEITELRQFGLLSDLTGLSERLDILEVELINSTKKYVETLGRYKILKISGDDRQTLTNYYTIIRSLSGEYPGDQAYARLKQEQERLFLKVKKILPVWSITNLSVGGQFPLAENIFDLLVIDEASQSDIASSLPLFFRSKNAVIIGDPQQLKHISNIRIADDNRLLQKHGLIMEDSLRFSYTIQSLYHCARGIVSENSLTLLNEHYRSHYSIIEFSNKGWYEGNLDIRTNYDNLFLPPEGEENLKWINVAGETQRKNGSSAYNVNEVNKILELLEMFHNVYGEKQPSIGIVTPYRDQGLYLQKKIIALHDEKFINKHLLIADTVHKFQGDERDIVIFSPVIASNIPNDSSLIGFLRSTGNLFNVAITRARSILWIVGDKDKCVGCGIPYLKSFVEYVENKKYENFDLPHEGFASPWEKKLYEVLVLEGYRPEIQSPAGPFFIDLVLRENNKKIAIEIDGERWHTDLSGERLERDLTRDKILKNMNFIVLRFWTHELKYDLNKCILRIKEALKDTQPYSYKSN